MYFFTNLLQEITLIDCNELLTQSHFVSIIYYTAEVCTRKPILYVLVFYYRVLIMVKSI